MSKSYLTQCPRCGTRSYEQLLTHGHCIECLHSADLIPPRDKRDFMTLGEAEALIQPVSAHPIRRDQKKDFGSRVVIWRNLKASVRNLWICLCRQWAEAEEIQRKIEVERLKAKERYGSDFPGRWL